MPERKNWCICLLCIFSFFYGISVSVSFCVTVCFEEGMQMVVFFCLSFLFFIPRKAGFRFMCVCCGRPESCYKTYLLCSSRVEVCVQTRVRRTLCIKGECLCAPTWEKTHTEKKTETAVDFIISMWVQTSRLQTFLRRRKLCFGLKNSVFSMEEKLYFQLNKSLISN